MSLVGVGKLLTLLGVFVGVISIGDGVGFGLGGVLGGNSEIWGMVPFHTI